MATLVESKHVVAAFDISLHIVRAVGHTLGTAGHDDYRTVVAEIVLLGIGIEALVYGMKLDFFVIKLN